MKEFIEIFVFILVSIGTFLLVILLGLLVFDAIKETIIDYKRDKKNGLL